MLYNYILLIFCAFFISYSVLSVLSSFLPFSLFLKSYISIYAHYKHFKYLVCKQKSTSFPLPNPLHFILQSKFC